MYAINHAATALLIKKHTQNAPTLLILISVQLVELLWVIFNYAGWEYFSISDGSLHLDFLPYSHSVFSAIVLALISSPLVSRRYKDSKIGLAFAIGVLSHVALDVIFHEKDIRLSPFSDNPTWGLGILTLPFLNFVIELLYGLFCCWYFNGTRRLLIAITILNFTNLPVMLAHGEILAPLQKYPLLLPSFILLQIVITWYFVWKYSESKMSLTAETQY